jgi:hypothetical protein
MMKYCSLLPTQSKIICIRNLTAQVSKNAFPKKRIFCVLLKDKLRGDFIVGEERVHHRNKPLIWNEGRTQHQYESGEFVPVRAFRRETTLPSIPRCVEITFIMKLFHKIVITHFGALPTMVPKILPFRVQNGGNESERLLLFLPRHDRNLLLLASGRVNREISTILQKITPNKEFPFGSGGTL